MFTVCLGNEAGLKLLGVSQCSFQSSNWLGTTDGSEYSRSSRASSSFLVGGLDLLSRLAISSSSAPSPMLGSRSSVMASLPPSASPPAFLGRRASALPSWEPRSSLREVALAPNRNASHGAGSRRHLKLETPATLTRHRLDKCTVRYVLPPFYRVQSE